MIFTMQTKSCSTGKLRTVLLKEVKNKHIRMASFTPASNSATTLKTLTNGYFSGYPKICSVLNLPKKRIIKIVDVTQLSIIFDNSKIQSIFTMVHENTFIKRNALELRFRTDTGNILEPTIQTTINHAIRFNNK